MHWQAGVEAVEVELGVKQVGLVVATRLVSSLVQNAEPEQSFFRPAGHADLVAHRWTALCQLLIDRERRSDHVPTTLTGSIAPRSLAEESR